MLTKDDVQWVVNNHGEIGVKIGQHVFFCYKGESLEYSGMGECHYTPTVYRPIQKREAGETLMVPGVTGHDESFDYKAHSEEELGVDKSEWIPLPVPKQ